MSFLDVLTRDSAWRVCHTACSGVSLRSPNRCAFSISSPWVGLAAVEGGDSPCKYSICVRSMKQTRRRGCLPASPSYARCNAKNTMVGMHARRRSDVETGVWLLLYVHVFMQHVCSFWLLHCTRTKALAGPVHELRVPTSCEAVTGHGTPVKKKTYRVQEYLPASYTAL